MPDPVFTQNDRVETPLPPEIQGKTPAQIAQYYQDRERTIRAEAQTAIANAAAGTPPPPVLDVRHHTPAVLPVTRENFESDPLAATQQMINQGTVSRAEWNAMLPAVQSNMIETARDRAKQGKQYWGRVEQVINILTKDADPISKLDTGFWNMAYNAAVGQELGRLQQEDAAAARSSAEPPSGGSLPPPAPRELSAQEMRVVSGMQITPDIYRDMETKMRENKFPVTLDNRRRRA